MYLCLCISLSACSRTVTEGESDVSETEQNALKEDVVEETAEQAAEQRVLQEDALIDATHRDIPQEEYSQIEEGMDSPESWDNQGETDMVSLLDMLREIKEYKMINMRQVLGSG